MAAEAVERARLIGGTSSRITLPGQCADLRILGQEVGPLGRVLEVAALECEDDERRLLPMRAGEAVSFPSESQRIVSGSLLTQSV